MSVYDTASNYNQGIKCNIYMGLILVPQFTSIVQILKTIYTLKDYTSGRTPYLKKPPKILKVVS